MSIFFTLIGRLKQGFSSLPIVDSSSWAIAIGVYILFVAIYGWRSGFLEWMRSPKDSIIRIMATSFFAPALLEEAFFRVLLLPYPDHNISVEQYCLWSIVSLFLFIIYHPLNAMTAFPQGRKTFGDRRFLVLATAVGIVCTLTYWQTNSIWLPILIHWLTVVIWLLYFGGINRLGLNRESNQESN